jgi:hypothetical protein
LGHHDQDGFATERGFQFAKALRLVDDSGAALVLRVRTGEIGDQALRPDGAHELMRERTGVRYEEFPLFGHQSFSTASKQQRHRERKGEFLR